MAISLSLNAAMFTDEAPGRILLGVAAAKDNLDAGMEAPHLGEGLYAVHVRHGQVEEHADDLVKMCVKHFQCLRSKPSHIRIWHIVRHFMSLSYSCITCFILCRIVAICISFPHHPSMISLPQPGCFQRAL